MPRTPEEILAARREQSPEIFGSYTKAGKYFEPPAVDEEFALRKLEAIEKRVDAILGQNITPNAEYMEIGRIANPQIREEILKELQEVFGMRRSIIDNGVGTVIGSRGRPYYYDRLDPNREVDIVSLWHEQHAKQWHPEWVATNVDDVDLFSVSGRQLRSHGLQRLKSQINDMKYPSDFVTFDIETSGLHPNNGDRIWQIAARSSREDLSSHFEMRFKPPMQGTVGNRSLLSNLLDAPGPEPVDFDQVKDFLKFANKHDAFVGQNVNFDINFLIESISKMGALKTDKEFAKLFADFSTKAAGSEVYDTLQLGRHFLNPDMAPELQVMLANKIGRGSPNSLENVLLQSNLLDLAVSRHGLDPKELQTLLHTQGLHNASVDTLFEHIYAQELGRLITGEPGELLKPTNGFNLPGLSSQEHLALRGRILQQAAMTPYMSMGYDQVDPVVMQHLMNIRDSQEVVRELPELKAMGHNMKFVAMNPVEHSLLQAKLLGPKSVPSFESGIDTTELTRGLIAIGRIEKGMKKKEGGLVKSFEMPSIDQYRGFQETLAKSRLPYANLGMEERLISEAMAKNAPVGSIHALASDALLHSKFFTSPDQVKVVGKSKRLVLQPSVLREAEAAGVFTSPEGIQRTDIAGGRELYKLSPFSHLTTNGALVHDISANLSLAPNEADAEREAKALKAFLLDNADRFKLTTSDIEEIKNLNIDKLHKYGVQVGTMLDRSNGPAVTDAVVNQAHDYLTRLSGGIGTDLADENVMHYGVTMVGEGEGDFTASAAVSTKGMAGEVLDEHILHSRASAELAENLTQEVEGNPGLRNAIEYATTSGKRTIGLDVQDYLEGTVKFIGEHKTGVKAGAVAGLAASAYYLMQRRKKKNAYYEDTFAAQPYESDGWQDRYQQEMASNFNANQAYSDQNSLDPMSTAYVVQNLDRGKIGHTSMSPNKNSRLFGGY